MFKTIAIKNFRGFKDFSMSGLERINLITGANDVGKTALLEAIYLLIGATNPALLLKVYAMRGFDKLRGDPNKMSDWLWTPLFYKFGSNAAISLRGETANGKSREATIKLLPRTSTHISFGEPLAQELHHNGYASHVLQLQSRDETGAEASAQMFFDEQGIRITPPATSKALPGYFIPARAPLLLEEDAKLYGEVEIEKAPYELIDVLRIIEPRLTRLSTVIGAGGGMLWGDIGLGKMLPMALMGEGLERFASILLRIANARGGIVLIDEIDNGWHHSVMEKTWEAIAEAARRFEVQIFATTHSWECIRAAHGALSKNGVYDFRLFRLDHSNGEIAVAAYDQETLVTSLDLNFEVR